MPPNTVIEGDLGSAYFYPDSDAALKAGIDDENVFDKGIHDLYRTAEADGVFCYTFFKAVATRK